MRPSLTVALALLGIGIGACGDSHHGTRSTYAASSISGRAGAGRSERSGASLPWIVSRGDADGDSDTYYGEVDEENRPLGKPAEASDRHAITILISRYYHSVATHDWSSTCRLIYSTLAEEIVKSYERPLTPPGLRGTGCTVVMPDVFRHLRWPPAGNRALPSVDAVRVEFSRAAVQLRFRGVKQAHYLRVRRERGIWKIATVSDIERSLLVE